MKTHLCKQLLLVVLITLLLTSVAHAHKVRVFAWQEGDTVFTEAKFSGGKPAKNVDIFVENPSTQKRVASGKTDSAGNYQFTVPTPQLGSLNIVVDGGDGHRNSWTHTLENATIEHEHPQSSRNSSAENTPKLPVNTAEKTHTNIDIDQLTAVLETVLDKKLGPIKKTLAENSERSPSLQDILGGIGYILGLAGIAAYVKSKKQ